MKHLNLKSVSFVLGLLILSVILNQCSDEEVIKVTGPGNSITTKPRGDSLFVGIHLQPVQFNSSVNDLIIGFTYQDSSYRQTDSLRGAFIITNSDQLTSCYDSKNDILYFFYMGSGSDLHIGVVDGKTGKYLRGLDISGSMPTYAYYMQCNDGTLYFSTGSKVYSVDTSTGNLTLEETNPSVKSGGWWFSNSHAITKTHFYYVKYAGQASGAYYGPKLMIKDRTSGAMDSIGLPGNYCDYRSLLFEPVSNCLYSYNTDINSTSVETFKISKINLATKAISNTMLDKMEIDHSARGVFYQPQFHRVKNAYSYKFFENGRDFQIIDMTSGKLINYPTPSRLGQCIFK